MLKPYFKPGVTRLELRPAEQCCCYCKTSDEVAEDAMGNGLGGCASLTLVHTICGYDYGS